MNSKLHKIILTSVLSAVICVATMIIQVPSPMGGYVNLGDCFVIVSAWILGPVFGFTAAGIGSALADLISGYVIYIPATFVIKGSMAIIASIITGKLLSLKKSHDFSSYTIGSVASELVMIFGYALYDTFLYGGSFIAALSSIGNFIQGICGIFASTALIRALFTSGVTAKIHAYTEKINHHN